MRLVVVDVDQQAIRISIHALQRGATVIRPHGELDAEISIHAPSDLQKYSHTLEIRHISRIHLPAATFFM